jgi:hypothetical protein
MDPRKLFVDSRLIGLCIYCGGSPDSREHCPSKVLLDDPFPADLPVVEACKPCNESFSADEQYLACLVECVLSGSTEPTKVKREKIRRILEENPKLSARIKQSERRDQEGKLYWEAEPERVRNVVVKLARGHLAYEFGLPLRGEPNVVSYMPLVVMPENQISEFEAPESDSKILWPEIGSRAFIRACITARGQVSNDWIVVQPHRYRYLVGQSDGDFVQLVLSEYLACRIVWS